MSGGQYPRARPRSRARVFNEFGALVGGALLEGIERYGETELDGRLEMRFSYSNTLGWNTFPVPLLTEKPGERKSVEPMAAPDSPLAALATKRLTPAKAVIASLWTADDTFTVSLMRRLYQHLRDGVDKGTALRQAKLDVLNQFGDQALPQYWAGFKLVGDGSAVIFE